MSRIYDMIIIGSGPAGLAAAVYGQRAKLDLLVIEKQMISGGQILNTTEVDNYPGLPGIGGFELGQKFREHAEKLGAPFVTDEVTEVRLNEDGTKTVVGSEESYTAKTLVIASGAESELAIDGLFIAVGIVPESKNFPFLATDERGYVLGDESCETNVPGVYAAGDVRKKQLRQVITAVADGANAVESAVRYLTEQ